MAQARVAVQITLNPRQYAQAKRLAKQRGDFLSRFLRDAAVETMERLERAEREQTPGETKGTPHD